MWPWIGSVLFAHNPVAASPTLDLDFMGVNIDREKDNLIHAFEEISSLDFNDGVVFHQDSITAVPIAVEKNYPGIRIAMIAALDSIRQAVNMDIGFGDVVTPCPVEMDYPTILEDFPAINLNAYSLETVVAEKFQTMVDRYLDNSSPEGLKALP